MNTIKSACNANYFLSKHPIVLLPIAVLLGAIAYGLPMAATLLFSPPSDGDSSAWAALVFGFLGLFIIPHSVELSLTKLGFLSLVFFVHGAVIGMICGLVGVFVIQWNNSSIKTLAYSWKCQVCGISNDAESSACIACQFPAIASAYEIKQAKLTGTSSAIPRTK